MGDRFGWRQGWFHLHCTQLKLINLQLTTNAVLVNPIYNYNMSVRACVRPTRQFRVLMTRRNRAGRSDSENGNRPDQSDSENGRPDRAGRGRGQGRGTHGPGTEKTGFWKTGFGRTGGQTGQGGAGGRGPGREGQGAGQGGQGRGQIKSKR
jgi:hypothetical protein